MLDHIGLGVSNLEASKAFYVAALAPLGIGVVMEFPGAVGLGTYGIELDVKYVDVVVQRWQQLTGKDAKLDGDGRTFDDVALARRREAA